MESRRHAITSCGCHGQLIGTNAGLLRDKYLRALLDDKGKNDTDSRSELFNVMRKSLNHSISVYQSAHQRQKTGIPGPKEEGLFSTTSRLIIGLGGESVLETGITLHHTYGTPLIPGSALKGLASHYCDQVWGTKENDDGFKKKVDGGLQGQYYKAIFGNTEDSGHIIFHDAWITPDTMADSLQPDVMAPHHGDYYSGKAAPTDFDNPNPISFLSVVGTFHVAVSCDVPGIEGHTWAKLAFDLLKEALEQWGIGGKTNAGYGRLALEGDELAH